jgi:hypothetical protein
MYTYTSVIIIITTIIIYIHLGQGPIIMITYKFTATKRNVGNSVSAYMWRGFEDLLFLDNI